MEDEEFCLNRYKNLSTLGEIQPMYSQIADLLACIS